MVSSGPVSYFQKRAKYLLDAFVAGDADAVARVKAVLHGDLSSMGLMKALHVTAVEHGFPSWDGLVHAEEVELRLVITMAKEPILCSHGIGMPSDNLSKPVVEQRALFAADRASLRADVASVAWAIGWLRANIKPINTISRRRTSYGLKHLAEPDHPKGYITNGAFIAAAIIAGYRYRLLDGPNVAFGMSEASITDCQRRRGSF